MNNDCMYVHRTILSRLVLALVLAGIWIWPSPVSAAKSAQATTLDDEIIYIDSNGVIRVIDPNVPTTADGRQYQRIEWFSPEGGWFDFATGDFNNDGDHEIVAIGNGKLTIYDPVVRSTNVTPNGEINGVPWAILYEQSAPNATLIGAGNLDQGVAGDEIIYGISVSEPNNINYRLIVLKKTANDNEARAWETHINKAFGAPWRTLAVGNINNRGSDDVVLTREADNLIEAHEIDNDFATIYSRRDGLFSWTHAAIGQVHAGGLGEVAVTRTFAGSDEAPSFLIYRFDNNQEELVDSGVFYPHPRFVFMGDVNGNGDDEVFWLRDVPAESTVVRLYMFNEGGDTLPGFSSRLDDDNGYKVGAAGDIDGDGRAEVVVMRNNRILAFSAPESGDTSRFIDYAGITTNSRSLKLADLDGQGYLASPRFHADPDRISVQLFAGTSNLSTISVVRLTNAGSGGELPFTAIKERGSSWFSFSLSQNTTPANLFISGLDATNLTPGVYTDRIRITSSNQAVSNQPYFIEITLTVNPAPFGLTPSSLGFVFLPDEDEEKSRGVSVGNINGLEFTAAILSTPALAAAQQALGGEARFGYISEDGELVLTDGLNRRHAIPLDSRAQVSGAATTWPSGVPWATATSVGNSITPDTITVTVTPDQLEGDAGDAVLVVIGDNRAGDYPENVAFAPIFALKAQSQSFMPLVFR